MNRRRGTGDAAAAAADYEDVNDVGVIMPPKFPRHPNRFRAGEMPLAGPSLAARCHYPSLSLLLLLLLPLPDVAVATNSRRWDDARR